MIAIIYSDLSDSSVVRIQLVAEAPAHRIHKLAQMSNHHFGKTIILLFIVIIRDGNVVG